MKSRHHALMLVAAAVSLFGIGRPDAARAEKNWQRACNRCSVPKHNYGHDTPRFRSTQFAVANAVVGQGLLRRKPFHFRALSLNVDHLQLDQVGLAIYQAEGKLVATGRITNNGGDGGIIGNNVTLRVRAYVAASADTFQIPPDAVVVWQAEHQLWVARGQEHISLAPKPGDLAQSEKLKLYFEEITHLEVELEYRRDR